MRHIMEVVLNDAAHGDYHPLAGMLDWLTKDCGIPVERLAKIAERQFGIPENISLATMEALSVVTYH